MTRENEREHAMQTEIELAMEDEIQFRIRMQHYGADESITNQVIEIMRSKGGYNPCL
jgi:hypothetical protein